MRFYFSALLVGLYLTLLANIDTVNLAPASENPLTMVSGTTFRLSENNDPPLHRGSGRRSLEMSSLSAV
jgi:hypothetical protein